jgi:GT2 family glycosyltransferase
MLRFRQKPDLSIVVIAFGMARELPRTLRSLSRGYQQDVDDIRYEVIVVDNGSLPAVQTSVFDELEGSFRLVRIDGAGPSPTRAANTGVRLSSGRNVCMILDGARMVTPGVVSAGVRALDQDPDAAVTTTAWHLGPDQQSRSIAQGFNGQEEDRLLGEVDWPHNGYGLFDISVFAGANPEGVYGPINESCCLMVSRRTWNRVGGFEERFDVAGGGLGNLDLFDRLVSRSGARLVILEREGSFHQVHGGASTAPGCDQAPWYEQYAEIRGRDYTWPDVPEKVYV